MPVACAVRPAIGLRLDLQRVITFFAPLVNGTGAFGAGSAAATFTRATVATHVDATSGLVVRDATGVARFEANGYLAEGARTNSCLWGDDLTNAAWAKTTMTTAFTATGADGTANSATTLTASAGNATALQAITLVSAATSVSCWIKRRTGSGTINLTMDNGSTWGVVTVTAGWTHVSIATQTLANPTVGIRIVTSGDAVDVGFFQCEGGAFASSAIPTTSAAVTRNADSLSYPAAGNVNNTSGSVVCSINRVAGSGSTIGNMIASTAENRSPLYTNNGADLRSYDGTSLSSLFTTGITTGSSQNIAVTYSGTTRFGYLGSTKGTSQTFDGNFDRTTEAIGTGSQGALYGSIKGVLEMAVPLNSPDAISLTARPF